MKLGFLFFILVQLSIFSLTDTAALTSWSYPSSVTGIQGHNITITYVANLSDHAPGVTWKFVRMMKDGNQMISIEPGKQKTVHSPFDSRASDLDLIVTQTDAIVTIKFTLSNLTKATDEGQYSVNPFGTSDFQGGAPTSPTSVSINVQTTITSPNLSTVTVNETQTAQLECTATGHPTPSFNWTRDCVIVGTGSPYTTPPVTSNDDKACYTCGAYNGVLDANTANVCLNVQYNPRNATILSDRSTVCQNDKVNLTCTSGPANPAPSSYEFYDNGVLVRTSASNVYEATATAGLPSVNRFVCVPRNLLGTSLENGSVEVTAKVAPAIVTSPLPTTLLEGSSLTLFCNASGVPAPDITWTKVGGGIVGSTETFSISNVKRGDEGSYRCTSSNSNECSNAAADANVVVNYKPHLTNLTSTKTEACLNDSVTLQCKTNSNPPAHEYRLYLNDQLVHTSMSGVYQLNVPQAGNNTYKCEPKNNVGTGQNATLDILTKLRPIIVNTTPSQEIREGSSRTLYCNVEAHDEDINVTWHKVGSGQVSGSGVYTIPSVTHADSGSYECRAKTGNECEVKSTMITLTVISPPIISNIIVTEDSLTVSWNNLVLPHNTIATCLIYVIESFHGVNWMTSSNTSNEDSITCSIAGLKSSTLYRIQYFLQIHKNYVNGTIYIGTSAKVNRTGASSNHSTCDTGKAGNISCGVSSTILVAVIAVAIAVIVLLILVIVWMRFQGIRNDKRIKRQGKNQRDVSVSQSFSTPSFDTKTVYENEGFISRQTKPDANMALYEQVQNRGRVMNQGVVGPPSFLMENIPGRQARHETENQVLSQLKEPSYQALDQREMAGTKGVNVNEGSYGHLLGFKRSPDNTTAAALPQDQNPYQAMQPENQSTQYQSLQNMHRPSLNV